MLKKEFVLYRLKCYDKIKIRFTFQILKCVKELINWYTFCSILCNLILIQKCIIRKNNKKSWYLCSILVDTKFRFNYVNTNFAFDWRWHSNTSIECKIYVHVFGVSTKIGQKYEIFFIGFSDDTFLYQNVTFSFWAKFKTK